MFVLGTIIASSSRLGEERGVSQHFYVAMPCDWCYTSLTGLHLSITYPTLQHTGFQSIAYRMHTARYGSRLSYWAQTLRYAAGMPGPQSPV
jgi:hypothetical protein